MAERRMFAKTIISSDAFLDMPASARLLYYDLGMRADDDGFINNPRSTMRMTGASDDDIRLLISKKFVIPFESGIVVIKHWNINNYIQKDRYAETKYKEEKATLSLDENKAYTQTNTALSDGCIQNGYIPDTQVRLGKVSIGKSNIGAKSSRFTPPTLEEVQKYCRERNSTVDPVTFFEYFTEGNWVDGKGNKVKNWKQKVISWEGRNKKQEPPPPKQRKSRIVTGADGQEYTEWED